MQVKAYSLCRRKDPRNREWRVMHVNMNNTEEGNTINCSLTIHNIAPYLS